MTSVRILGSTLSKLQALTLQLGSTVRIVRQEVHNCHSLYPSTDMKLNFHFFKFHFLFVYEKVPLPAYRGLRVFQSIKGLHLQCERYCMHSLLFLAAD